MVLIDGKTSVKRTTSIAPDQNGARVADGQAPVGPSTTSMLSMQGGVGAMGGGMGAMGGGMGGGVPGMPGFGMGMNAAAMGGGNFDFFAHMAAAARMQAAMMRAMQDGEDSEDDEPEQKKAKIEDEGPAFDKDALARLAQQANEEPRPRQPLPPQFTQGGALSSSAAPPAPQVGAQTPAVADRQPLPPSSNTVVGDSIGPGAAPEAETLPPPPPPPPGVDRRSPSPEAELGAEGQQQDAQNAETPEKKKDALALTSLLQQVQSNTALAKEARKSEKVVQAFSIGTAQSGRSDGGQVNVAAGASVPPAPPRGIGAATGSLLESLLRRVEEGPVSGETRRAVEQEVLEALPGYEPVRAAELLGRVYASESLRTAELLDGIIQVILPSVAKFNSPHLTRVLSILAAWAVGCYGNGEEDVRTSRISERCRDFFSASATELALRLMDVVPRDLAQIATALSAVGHMDARLYGSLARAAVARSERFTPQEIVSLGVAFDRAGYVHSALFETLAKTIRTSLRELSQRELLRGVVALARAGIRDEELGLIVGDLVANKEGGLLTEELCTLAWAFVTLGMYHDAMFRIVLRAMEDAAVVSGETLCQLYEVHHALVVFRHDLYKPYELPADTVHTLREHYKKNRGGKTRELRLERESEKFHKEVKSVLMRVVRGECHAQFQTPAGFSADVACMRKRSSSKAIVLIELDGPNTLVQSLDPQGATQASPMYRVRGDVLLKRRVLQHQGFHMAVFSEELWKTFDDGRDKRDFLRELLRIAGVRSSSMS